VFLGEYERSLDSKGRLAVPAELRADLGHGAILARSFDTCLCIYPAEKWEALVRAADDLSEVRYEVRALIRSLFSGAVPMTLDRQGRVVVPAFLREHADLHGEVVVVGVGSRVEIWNKERWVGERQSVGDPRSIEGGAKLAEEMAMVAASGEP